MRLHCALPSLTFLICTLALAEPAAQVRIVDSGLVTRPQTEGTFAGMERADQSFTFSNGVVRYQINYHAYWDPKSEAVKQDPEGYLGMPGPSGCNWYAGGFMAVRFSGADLGNVRPAVMRAVEQGARGIAEVFWKTPQGQLRLRFLQEPGVDYLATEIGLQPSAEAAALELSLRCFPSFFTSWNHKDGWRQVASPAGTTEQGQTKPLAPTLDHWLLYQDTVFDRAKNPTDSQGPCGLLMLPEQIKTASLAVTSYPVTTTIVVKPEVRSLRLAFWDFTGKTNAEALQCLKTGGAEVAAHLRELDFRDSQVAAFDPERERAELEAMIAKSATPVKWRTSMAPLFDQIVRALQAYKSNDLSAEQKASEALAKYREAVWDLKFDALLSD